MKTETSLKTTLLKKWSAWAVTHWGKALILGIVITIVASIGFSMLHMEMTFYSILPQGSKKVEELKDIVENFPLSSAITVVVEAQDKTDKEKAKDDIKKSIDALIGEFNKPEYTEYVDTVTGKAEKDFFKDFGLLIQKKDDLLRFKDIYSDLRLAPLITNLNNDFEKEYSGNEDNLTDNEQLAISQFKGLEQLLSLMEKSLSGKTIEDRELNSTIDYMLYGEEYFFNKDDTIGLLLIQPTFDINNIAMLSTAVPLIDKITKKIALENNTTAGLTGLTVVGKDEMVTSEQGLALSMLIAFILILALMIITFRMFSIPLISGIPLILGIVWTAGITGFVLHRLNIMTAMYMVVLIGLGIDYAIHLLTTYVQEKDDGKSTQDAMVESFIKSGPGILTGALTTASAFFALIIAQNKVVKELGFVAGIGILAEYFAMMIFIPALIGFRDYRIKKSGKKESAMFLNRKFGQSRSLPGLGGFIKKYPVMITVLFIIIAGVLMFQAPGVTVQDNLMEMEAKGLESVELQDRMVKEFEMAPDCLYVRTNTLEEVKNLTKKLDKLASVKMVDSISPYLATESEIRERIPVITEFEKILAEQKATDRIEKQTLSEELDRLGMNFEELSILAYSGGMQRMSYTLDTLTGINEKGEKVRDSVIDKITGLLESDPESANNLGNLQQRVNQALRQKLLFMTRARGISVKDLPETIKNSYISKTGDDYLISIYPTQNPWVRQYRDIFVKQVDTITPYATGMILAADQMTAIAEVDTVKASIVAFIIIFLLLLVDLKNIKLSIITMLPLTFSLFSLFGIMALANIKFDFVNIIGIPLVIGIGIDDAVHISHRYLYEGKGKIDLVITKTGAAVFLTSLTTMIGFASFIPSVMRAMQSTGIVLTIAVGLAFIFSIMFHSSLIVTISEKLNLNIMPWKGMKKRSE
ncbi:MAG: MMPL family transporter [Spirochaetales bacterium]|nr:MMPL family transporter [Spirochaetales bacterium]